MISTSALAGLADVLFMELRQGPADLNGKTSLTSDLAGRGVVTLDCGETKAMLKLKVEWGRVQHGSKLAGALVHVAGFMWLYAAADFMRGRITVYIVDSSQMKNDMQTACRHGHDVRGVTYELGKAAIGKFERALEGGEWTTAWVRSPSGSAPGPSTSSESLAPS